MAHISGISDYTDNAPEDILNISRINYRQTGLTPVLMRDNASWVQLPEDPPGAPDHSGFEVARDSRRKQFTMLLSVPGDILLWDSKGPATARLRRRKCDLNPHFPSNLTF